jgi:hypothetical protein
MKLMHDHRPVIMCAPEIRSTLLLHAEPALPAH